MSSNWLCKPAVPTTLGLELSTHQIVSVKEQTIHCGLFFLNLPMWSPQIATPSILNLVSEYPYLPLLLACLLEWLGKPTQVKEGVGDHMKQGDGDPVKQLVPH